MAGAGNAINETTTGICGFTGTAFVGTPVTNHAVQVGASTSSALTSLSVGATGTILQGSTGADPAFTATPSVTSITLSSGTALSTYVQNTYTPVLAFGGASVGITYSAQTGNYTQIGNVVHFALHIQLSSKGSSTGNASVTLPVNNGGGTLAAATASVYSGLTLTALNTEVGGYIQSNIINMTQTGSAQTFSAITNSMFGNTTDLYITGLYFTS